MNTAAAPRGSITSMRRAILVLAALVIALGAVAAGPSVERADAAKRLSAAQLAKALQKRHAFRQAGVTPKPDMQALNAVAAANPSFYLVVLKKPLAGSSNAKGSARLLVLALQPTDPRATVGIIQGGKLAGASLAYPQERIDKAVADTGGVAATDPTGALTSYVQAVSKPNKNPDANTGGSGGGGRPFWQWLILIGVVAGVVLVLLRLRARSNEQRRRRRGGSVWTAREFHLDRLEALAARHAALTGEATQAGEEDPKGSDDPEVVDHLQTGGARILALRRTLPNLTSPRELRTVAGELDAVEWEILWVEHRLADQAPPPALQRGFPGLCFFSHEHGLGTEPIELRKPDGTIATVWVSPENRLALERGDAPDVSMVHVGSRMVPWPTAPSWYGAYGWTNDDLPGLEYAGQQIWGIDGPEREPEPDFGTGAAAEPSGEAVAEPSGDVPPATAQPTGTGPVATRDGELGLPEEEPTRHEEPTSAWSPDEDAPFEDDHDAFAAPAEPAAPAAPAPADEPSDSGAWAPPGGDAPSAFADEPSGFEELDLPAPGGLVAEPVDEDSADQLFPAPPEPPALADDEDTLDGAPPARPESTLEWDPFDDDRR